MYRGYSHCVVTGEFDCKHGDVYTPRHLTLYLCTSVLQSENVFAGSLVFAESFSSVQCTERVCGARKGFSDPKISQTMR